MARPRRFGKSLLISTFESLFKYGLRDFQGLAIEQLWKEESTYEVIRLDFSRMKDFASVEEFNQRLASLFTKRFGKLGFKTKETESSLVCDDISNWFEEHPRNSFVLLIDEYDAPLTACLNNPVLFDRVCMKLADFYAMIKSNDGSFRFLFMTGITKFSKFGIFSELNNLKDISLLPNFGALLGYTYEEVKLYFKDYLTESAKQLGIKEVELLNELTNYYDGFCFERTEKCQVFAPWSLLNFFSDPEVGFINYWFESGGQPKVLLEYIKSHSIKEPAEYEREKKVLISELSGSFNVDHINDQVLLTQAGYLTIKAVKGSTVILGYPNKEVPVSMASLYSKIILNEEAMDRTRVGLLGNYLGAGEVRTFIEELNRIILGIDYKKFPLNSETSCCTAVHLMLASSQLNPFPELNNSFGKSFLDVGTDRYHWVLEFRFTKKMLQRKDVV